MAKTLTADEVIASIPVSPGTNTIWLGFSGGLDSHVLLYLLSQNRHLLPANLIAVHVNHGLNAHAEQWSGHCRNICDELGVDMRLLSIDAKAPPGESPEAWARDLRYQAMRDLLGEGDILLTAHHSDDMAETLLLQLFRGAGPAGLAAMPAIARFGKGWHCRPLLGYTRKELQLLAEADGLSWIDDDSNLDHNFDRNYLRHRLIPVICRRWPAIAHTLTRSARLQADASELLEDLAEIDLPACINKRNACLNIPALERLSAPRAANTIRYWIKLQGHPVPTSAQLDRIFEDVIRAKIDAEPCVRWDGIELRRHRESLFLTRTLPENPAVHTEIDWQLDNDCRLVLGNLSARRGLGNGIKAELCPDRRVRVKYRRGSELIKKGGHHHKLKKLFQEFGIPSCFRDYIPLIYVNDKLALISGLMVDEDFAAAADEEAFQIRWEGADEVFALAIP